MQINWLVSPWCESLSKGISEKTLQSVQNYVVDQHGKHSEFPGPSFWHFRKTEETYRGFTGELLIAERLLLGIKKFGHDLDKTLAKGIITTFVSLSRGFMYIIHSHQ